MSQNRLRSLFAASAAAVIIVAAAGCGGDDNDTNGTTAATTTTQATDAAAGGTVGVEASEMKFVLTSDTAPAGTVTFNAENVGKVDHEMVVIKTDTPAADLPVKDGEVDESGSIGEIGPEDLKPGASSSLKLDMAAGHYALICALPGHYQAGMYKDFNVQ